MTITKIDLGHFSIPVRDPRLAAELQKLNTDGNDTINLEDIQLPHGVEDRGIQYRLLKKAVAAAFVNAGSISKDQQRSLEDTIDLYVEVQNFRRDVSNWHQWGKVGTYQGKRVLAFDYETYCSTSLYMQLPMSAIFRIENFATRLHTVLHGLGQTVCREPHTIRWSHETCDYPGTTYTEGLGYNPLQIPEDLRDPVKQVVQNYLTGANWLVQFDAAYCQDGRGKEGISSMKDLRFPRLSRIEEGPHNDHYVGKKLPECPEGGL